MTACALGMQVLRSVLASHSHPPAPSQSLQVLSILAGTTVASTIVPSTQLLGSMASLASSWGLLFGQWAHAALPGGAPDASSWSPRGRGMVPPNIGVLQPPSGYQYQEGGLSESVLAEMTEQPSRIPLVLMGRPPLSSNDGGVHGWGERSSQSQWLWRSVSCMRTQTSQGLTATAGALAEQPSKRFSNSGASGLAGGLGGASNPIIMV